MSLTPNLSRAGPRTGPTATDIPGSNPFVDLPYSARAAVVFFVVFWRVLPDLAEVLQIHDADGMLVTSRFVVSTTLNGLLILPFLLRRFAGTPIGWLHPLVLPAFLSIAKDLLNAADPLLLPIHAWTMPPVVLEHYLLQTASVDERLWVEIKRDMVLVAAQLAYLGGFAAVSMRSKPLPPSTWRVSNIRISALIAACFGVLFYFIESNGGLVQHFSALALGRFHMRENSGHFLAIISILPYLVLLWYAFEPRVFARLWFLPLFLLATAAQFAATGSRSHMLFPVVSLAAMWIWNHKQVPFLRLAVLGLIPFFLLGVLGDLRNSSLNGQSADTSGLSEVGFEVAALRTREELAQRKSLSGEIAIIHKVPAEVPYLYGESYIGTLAFFIPRSVWPEKPRGPGAYVAAVIFQGYPNADDYEGASYPTGGAAEAFWNFGVIGVLVAFGLFGLFHRYVTHKFLQRPNDPLAVLVMMLTVVTLTSIDSDSVIAFLQRVVPLLLVYLIVRRRADRSRAARQKI